MNINVNLINFLDLFNKQVQYSVPKWQRRYSWDESTIQQLIKDLVSVSERDDENAKHFGGTLITYSENTAPGSTQIDHVVDGQQRLTTISILLVCIADKLEKTETSGQWNSEKIRGVYLRNQLDPPRKLKLQEEDDEEYRRIMNGRVGGNGKVAEAWKILRSEIASVSPELLMRGLSRFQVIGFKCGKYDDPQQIFESLNATGIALTEGEKVKNWLLMGLDSKAQEKLYQDHWHKLEKCLDAIPEPKRIDEFVRDFLRWKTGENKGKKYVYADLRRWWYKLEGSEDRVLLCEELARLAELYGKITGTNGRHESNEIDGLLRDLRGIGFDVHRPFTLRLLDDATRSDATGANEEELAKVLRALCTWLIRLWVAGKSTSGLNTEAASFAHREDRRSMQSYAEYWINEIGKLRYSRIAVPNEEEIREGIRKRKAYGGKASDVARTILWKINSRLGRDAPPRIEDLSLEHIMPRKLSEEWQEYLGEDRDDLYGDYINSLANLTLVGKEFNAEISNQIYAEKRKLYQNSTVMLTRKLAQSFEHWQEEDIEERIQELTELVLKCWPWENVIRARGRWRIVGEHDWRNEKKYSDMLVNVISILLDEDPKGNSERLLGNRVRKDIFLLGERPIGTGSFRQIPRHNEYEVYTHFSGQDICKLCLEMSERCDVQIEIDVSKKTNEGQLTWERVRRSASPRAPETILRWRINQGNWRKEKSYRAMLLNLVKELLDLDPLGNVWKLSGDSVTRDLLPSHYSPKDPTRYKRIPGYRQYMINVDLTRINIIRQCKKLGERCGVVIGVEEGKDQDIEQTEFERKVPRWRVNQGDWQEEKSYAATLLNVVGELLNIDPEGNSQQLLGDRMTRDIFRSGMEPTSTSARFRPIPGHDGYVVNLNFNGTTIFNRCREMGDRCGVVVEVEIIKSSVR